MSAYGTRELPIGGQPEWHLQAACSSHSHLFYAPDGERQDSRSKPLRIQAAKSVCRGCPVLLECRQKALKSPDDFGIMGGLTPDEQRAASRRQ